VTFVIALFFIEYFSVTKQVKASINFYILLLPIFIGFEKKNERKQEESDIVLQFPIV